jgi:hypothetical protein
MELKSSAIINVYFCLQYFKGCTSDFKSLLINSFNIAIYLIKEYLTLIFKKGRMHCARFYYNGFGFHDERYY